MSFASEYLAAFSWKPCLLLLYSYPENICNIIFSLELKFSVRVHQEAKPKHKQLITEVFSELSAVTPVIVALRRCILLAIGAQQYQLPN